MFTEMEVILQPRFTVEEMLPQLALIQQLTPHLTAEQYECYLQSMIPNHYAQLVALCDGVVAGVSGYWLCTKLYCGPYLEIDNFIVDHQYRRAGIGSKMVQWLEAEARNHDCHHMMLDAYLENHLAHNFYKREGFTPKGYHFMKAL
jgi:GNAT superfamily N-acetyltransferase